MHSSAIDGYEVENYTENDLKSIKAILKSIVESLREKLRDKYLGEDNQIVFVILIAYMLSEPDPSKLMEIWAEAITDYNKAIKRDWENKKSHLLLDIFRKPDPKPDGVLQFIKNMYRKLVDNRSNSDEEDQYMKNIYEKLVENKLNFDEEDQYMKNIYEKLVEEINKSSNSEANKELQIEILKNFLETIDLITIMHSLAHRLTTKIKFLFTESQNETSELKIEEEGIRDFVHLEMRNYLVEVLKKATNVEIVLSKEHGQVMQMINTYNSKISKIARSYVDTYCNCQFGSTDLHEEFIRTINRKLKNYPINPQTLYSKDQIVSSRKSFERHHAEPLTKTFSTEKEKSAARMKMQRIIDYIDHITNKGDELCGISQYNNRLVIGCENYAKHSDFHYQDMENTCIKTLEQIVRILERISSKDEDFFYKAGITDINLCIIADYKEKYCYDVRLAGVNLTIDFSLYSVKEYEFEKDFKRSRGVQSSLGNILLKGDLTIIGTVTLDSDYGYQEKRDLYPDSFICKILVDGQIKIAGDLIVEEGRNEETVVLIKAYSLLVEGSLIGNLDINLIPVPSNRRNIKNTVFVDGKIGASKMKSYISVRSGTTHNCAYVDSEGKATINLQLEPLSSLLGKARELSSPIILNSKKIGEYAYIPVEDLPGHSPFINPATCIFFQTNYSKNYIKEKETDIPETYPSNFLNLAKNAVSSFRKLVSSR